MLIRLGLMEQRHKAVLEVLSGQTVTQVALRYGVCRQTVHRWLRSYAAEGLAGLVDVTSRPATCPHQMSPEVEARLLALRHVHPGWGARTLRHELEKEGFHPPPGRSSVHRCLLRHHLVHSRPRRRKRGEYRRWERSRPMELWQMDVMGGVRLGDGRELKVVTGIDDHSRYCVCARLVARATARPVCEALALALRTHGVPDQILTDNGKVFTGRFGPTKGEVLFDRILRENGVRHLLTAPHSPTTTGKVERFHKTVRAEFLQGRSFASAEEAQAALDHWVEVYNSERPHQGIGMVVPAKRFALALEAAAQPLEETARDAERVKEPDGRRLTRRVTKHGRVTLANFGYHVGSWLSGETVEILVREDDLVEISHGGVLVATHARRHRVEEEPASLKRVPKASPVRPETTGCVVVRKVDSAGNISFAGASYRVGMRLCLESVEVRVVGDTVQIAKDGRLLRSHLAKHDPQKEHGAFANPAGRPRRKNQAS